MRRTAGLGQSVPRVRDRLRVKPCLLFLSPIEARHTKGEGDIPLWPVPPHEKRGQLLADLEQRYCGAS